MIIRGANFGLFKRAIEPDRPRVKPELTPADWMLEAVALITMVSLIGFIAYNYPKLPDIIPTHFNAAGNADDHGGKGSILFLPGIAVFIYILMTLINLVPHTFNFPGKITPQNALRQYTLATRLVRYLKTVLLLLFFYISYTTTRVVFNEAAGLGLWFMPVFLGLVMIPIIVYMIVALHNKAR
jgi:uncharacterized membrane protein